MFVSSDPEITNLGDSMEKIHVTAPLWPVKILSNYPFSFYQIFNVPSLDAEIILSVSMNSIY